MAPSSEDLQREVAALIKQSLDMRLQAQELLKTADELRKKAERLKGAIQKSQS